jgi:hypothetical protein
MNDEASLLIFINPNLINKPKEQLQFYSKFQIPNPVLTKRGPRQKGGRA